MEYIVDRIEGNFLILEGENEQFFKLSADALPEAKEGDIIQISVLQKKTKERKKDIENLMETLFKD